MFPEPMKQHAMRSCVSRSVGLNVSPADLSLHPALARKEKKLAPSASVLGKTCPDHTAYVLLGLLALSK